VPSDQFIIVLTTYPLDKDADSVAATLVEERLAACVNILPPMRSVYRWKDAVERTDERQMVIKTTIDRLRALETRLRGLHPYEVPEFIVISVEASSDYASWLADSTRP
jgi:periplasmic divalent cation tolerance protein